MTIYFCLFSQDVLALDKIIVFFSSKTVHRNFFHENVFYGWSLESSRAVHVERVQP